MIFNPYDLPALIAESAPAVSQLPWAEPQLADNPVLVVLTLAFLVIDLLACRPKGVMRYQFSWLIDTRNARTFESTVTVHPWIKPLLLLQVFLFFGLAIFCLYDDAPAAHLHSLGSIAWIQLGLSMSALLGWYVLQSALFNWFCYLFGLREKRTIMNRTYRASYAVLAPLAMLSFIFLISGTITSEMMHILLAALFIFSQLSFVFNGFRIFYNGFYSILLLIVYLCTLEIAPLLVIWTKITTLPA